MDAIITALHVIVCFFLVAVVLLQRGKGAQVGAVFGGGGGATMFGSRGAGNFLTLIAEPVPDEPGIFFYGPNRIRLPFGNGFLCVGGGLTRILPPDVASGNSVSRQIENTPFVSGQVVYFQYWFHDPAGGGAFFNTSNALSVTFQ